MRRVAVVAIVSALALAACASDGTVTLKFNLPGSAVEKLLAKNKE